MTSKIKVDNINKVSDDSNIINKCGTTITLGASGDSIALASGASQTGFGRTGTVDWQTSIQTSASFTAVNGQGFFIDTSSNAITANLPAGTAGSIVAFRDYASNFNTNALTIAANGSQKIENSTEDFIVSVNGESLTLVYADDTKGWLVINDANKDAGVTAGFITATGGTITTVCTNFKVHTFTGPGTFCVSAGGGPQAKAGYLVVAGGGGSGANTGPGPNSGGGGGGGYREGKSDPVTGPYSGSPLAACTSVQFGTGAFPITVGAGGAAAPCNEGGAGSNSILNYLGSTVTSAGGGGGRGGDGNPGSAGGSGGGGAATGNSSTSTGGAGNTPPVSPSQGFPGGGGGGGPGAQGDVTGGGGGATEAGVTGNAPGTASGRGGAGTTTSITASPVAYAGGGGGGGRTDNGVCNGAASPCGTGGAGGTNAGTTNRGGGGGGGISVGPCGAAGRLRSSNNKV